MHQFSLFMKHFRSIGILAFGLIPAIVLATGVFSDVQDNYPYKGEIESLTRSDVIHGNPDGKFYPDRTVNRAEFLKMLYLAANKTPKAIYSGCFQDIDRGSWYELFVCDAASREIGIVQGYPDGTFRPAAPVSRTEALKMMFLTFGINTPDISEADRSIIKFVDVSVSAWYSKYISAAYISGVLPIAGQAGARFYPEQALTRGEAAAYIWNGLTALNRQKAETLKSTSSVSSSASSAPTDIVKEVIFPFTDADHFQVKKPVAYVFNLSGKTTVWARVTLDSNAAAEVTCRLYLLTADGFSNEYYLGYQNGNQCTIRATVRPGKYQFQIQPTVENLGYAVQTKVDTSDGNDGFVEAVKLILGTPKTSVLMPNDIYDWYSFSVSQPTTATVGITSTEPVDCIVNMPGSVDQYGFKGPQCNIPYQYVPTDDGEPYVIGIARHGELSHKVTYTLKFE